VDDDPFGCADRRRRVLDAWTASPSRFREDANAEEDHARGGYRDRLVVELAQNAADAAARAGVPGRLLLRLERTPADGVPGTLVAANTGAPLDADGVEALATLRASAKRDDDPATTVGRFGVGFAAVLAVTDEPAVRSRTGGVRWSAEATRAEVAATPALAAEVGRREGHVPVLRLTWPDAVSPPEGYDTAVVLPLRDELAVAFVADRLAGVDAALLLMLPALAEVVVDDGSGPEPRVLRSEDLSVRSVVAAGRVTPDLVADRPTEERGTRTWWVRWATPRPDGVPAVVHAPTPTDEPLDLPALLMASFPLEPSRRHVAPGPLSDLLVERAADAYADLLRAEAPRGVDAVLALVPGPVASGPLDARLRRAVLDRLRETAVLPVGEGLLRAAEAVAVDGLTAAAYEVLAEAVPGLVPPAWSARHELDRLGVRRLRLADLLDDLAALDRQPEWWRLLYEATEDADRDQLSGLPVPLADGRLVRGPRGVVVGAEEPVLGALLTLGFRVAEPAAAAPALVRLGAVDADPALLLDEPVLRGAVAASLDADDPAPLAEAVLALVAAAHDGTDRPWLGELALPDDEGGWAAAGELVLPASPVAAVLRPGALAMVDLTWVERWGATVLRSVGCLWDLAVVADHDVPLDPQTCDHDLDREDEWVDDVVADLVGRGPADLPPLLPAFTAVRDLELVAGAAWPDVLRMLAAAPGLRAAVVEPQRALLADGSAVTVEAYTAWWLRTRPVLDGQRPDELRAPWAAGLEGLLPAAPDLGLDATFLRALGVATSLADVAAAPMELPLIHSGADPSTARPDDAGTTRPVPEVVRRLLPAAPATYAEHDELTVGGVTCDWWVADGTVHAATLDGLARGLAWASAHWEDRMLLAALLAEPGRADELLAERAFDRGQPASDG
jgi:hypothetical protein